MRTLLTRLSLTALPLLLGIAIALLYSIITIIRIARQKP
jgi:hypothetical protein